jgi:two-component system OmpR family sensor kinase
MMRPPLSFRARLALQWTVAFGLLLALADAAIYAGVRAYAYSTLDAQVRTLAGTELASSTDGPAGVHLHELPPVVLAGGAPAEKLVQIVDRSGRVVVQSPVLERSAAVVPRAALDAGFRGDSPVIAVSAAGRPARVVVLPSPDGVHVIAAGLFTDGVEAALSRLALLLLGVWVAALAVTGALGHVLTSSALRRVERITERAATIARGDFSARLDPPAVQDELGRMTRSLNQVLERLHGAIHASRRFASDASHELRGPMTAMAGEIDVALKRERSSDEYRETLLAVREGLDTLMAVTADLMTLARAQESRGEIALREVPLRPLVARSAEQVDALAQARGVRLRLDGLPDLVAYAEARLLGRVFDNVLANAVRYNREGGEVVVSGSFEEAAADAWKPGMVTVLVRDTGVGIPASEQERVFERFYRLDESRARQTGGTGLGLAICREVLDVLGGTIRIAASSPAGTTVEIRVPGHAGDADAASRRARPVRDEAPAGQRA